MNEPSLRHRRPRLAVQTGALADVPYLAPRLTLLGPDDCRRLHEASLHILQRTGVHVYHAGALRLLRQAGAQVTDDLVRIPAELVEAALASAPRRFALHRRGTAEPACLLDGEHVYFGPGSDTLRYLDPRTGQRRDFQLADVGKEKLN